MKKALLAAAAVAVTLPLFSSPTSAASWHKGTPRAIRGTYKQHTAHSPFTSVFKITSTKALLFGGGGDPDDLKDVHYKKSGHGYIIRGLNMIYPSGWNYKKVIYRYHRGKKQVAFKTGPIKGWNHWSKNYNGWYTN